MPKGKKSSNGEVVAAHEYIEDAVVRIGKHHDTLKAALSDAEEKYAESVQQFVDFKAASERAFDAMKASLEKQIDDWKQRAQAAEKKCAAAFQRLAE